VAYNEIPELPDYKNLKDFLELERKTLVKVESFSEDDEFIRDLPGATEVLNILRKFIPAYGIFLTNIHLFWGFSIVHMIHSLSL
jgi:hypothetical protein